MTDQLRDGQGRFASGMNELFRARTGLRVGVAHPEAHEHMNARFRGERGVADGEDDDEGDDATSQPWQGLDGGAGRERSVEFRSVSEQMSDRLREVSGRQPGSYGMD